MDNDDCGRYCGVNTFWGVSHSVASGGRSWKAIGRGFFLCGSLAISTDFATVSQAAAAKQAATSSKSTSATTGNSSNSESPVGVQNKASVSPDGAASAPSDKGSPAPPARFEIDEFRVAGADALQQIEVEESIYPFLGPGRTADDVEKARAALEKAYAAKGFQTVTVSIPQQNVESGIVILKVSEVKVGRLSVKNSRYFDTDQIKAKAPSVAEGKLPNFNAVTKDIVALNLLPDRKVTPALRAGVTPGTVDVDLAVEDKLPLHAGVEINDRQSPNTTPLRLNSTVHYDNLWQRGDLLSFSYQVAVQRPENAQVYSGSYLARTGFDWLNVLVYGVDSNSNVATVGSQSVVGPGQIIGARSVITLPTRENFFHSISMGIDYKHFGESIAQQGTLEFSTPVTYVPMVVNYNATWQREGDTTQLNAGLTYGLRGFGSTRDDFDNKRYGALQNFVTLRGDLSHTHEFPGGVQLFGKVQGQLPDQPLVSSEQYSMGGLDTVRGYLETETLGDAAVAGTIEVRTPNMGEAIATEIKKNGGDPLKNPAINEWRFFAFADAGQARILQPLPEQISVYELASYGVGARFKMFSYANGMLSFAMPVLNSTYTSAYHPRFLFRLWGEF